MTVQRVARDLLGVALGAAVAWFLTDSWWRGMVENDAPGGLFEYPG